MNPILLSSFLDRLNTLLQSEDRTLETTQRVFYEYVSLIDSFRELPKAEIAEILKTFSPHLPEFRRTSQNVEMELERLYARSILAKQSNLTGYLTERFEKIVAAEFALFDRFLGVQENRRILFCGGGPVPISPVLMALKDRNAQVTVIDQDAESCELTESILRLHPHLQNITVLPPVSVGDVQDMNQFDAIVLAAMIGSTQSQKVEIYTKIAGMIPAGKYLFTRSASPEGMSLFQYDQFPFDQLSGLYEKVVFQPVSSDVTVHTVVLRRK